MHKGSVTAQGISLANDKDEVLQSDSQDTMGFERLHYFSLNGNGRGKGLCKGAPPTIQQIKSDGKADYSSLKH